MNEINPLYVGGDDSNHAGQNKKGELNVATFSLLKEDSIVKNFPNKRDYSKTENWIKSDSRDYRFLILSSERFRYSSNNLIYTMPKLIRNYLEENDIYLKNLKIYLDGRLEKNARKDLKEIFEDFHGIEKVFTDNFIKKNKNKQGRIVKRPKFPALVYHADVLASILFKKPFEEIISDKKLVDIL